MVGESCQVGLSFPGLLGDVGEQRGSGEHALLAELPFGFFGLFPGAATHMAIAWVLGHE